MRFSRLSSAAWWVLFLVTPPASAAGEAWDQARATALAEQLEEAVDRFEAALEKEPAQTAAQGTPESAERLREQAKRLQNASQALAGQLGEGEGRTGTRGLYQNVSQLAADSAESARNQMLSEPVSREWARVAETLRKLAPYYEGEDSPPAERLEPTP
jgi:hypothetical protein